MYNRCHEADTLVRLLDPAVLNLDKRQCPRYSAPGLHVRFPPHCLSTSDNRDRMLNGPDETISDDRAAVGLARKTTGKAAASLMTAGRLGLPTAFDLGPVRTAPVMGQALAPPVDATSR